MRAPVPFLILLLLLGALLAGGKRHRRRKPTREPRTRPPLPPTANWTWLCYDGCIGFINNGVCDDGRGGVFGVCPCGSVRARRARG